MAQSTLRRLNRAIELLESDQAIYYDGPHTGHVLTYDQGRADAKTWADYINVGMEHGAFDMTGLEDYMRGLLDGGPTRSGHLTPTVIVEAPVNGTDGQNVAFNAWQFRQILARGVHGILLCQAESADAVREFVRACRFPHHKTGADKLGIGSRGRGSEPTAAPIWAVNQQEYFNLADPWPLNPKGELLLGVKIESPAGVANADEILECQDWALPSSDRAISACRWATPHCSAAPIRPKWRRHAPRSSRPARRTGSPSSRAPRRRLSRPASTRACG
jgi:4-hydroxy-2-oxoheptanedioate aldolase